jgi:hypothetical protein
LKVSWGGGWTVKLDSQRWWNMYLCTSKVVFAHGVLTVLCYPKHDEQDINVQAVEYPCSIGNGKVEENCFVQAHESEERMALVCKKYEAMQK